MSQFPPPVPVTPLNYAPPPPRNDLREIAVRQRAIMLCILGYFVLMLCQFIPVSDPLRGLLVVAAIAVSITGMVFVIMLSIAVYNTGAGIALGICTLIPLVGLIILLIVNGRATSVLRQHGIHVGLMGANKSQIPSPGQSLR
jgi:hypothetical protein